MPKVKKATMKWVEAMKNRPLVSIIIPVYNAENTIKNTINSVLEQTYKNIELILVDDGSKDSSAEIIKALLTKHQNIVFLTQENSGAGAARNHGIDKARGEYITFCDSDDLLVPEFVENLYKHFDDQTDIVVSGYQLVMPDGKVIAKKVINSKPLGIYGNISTCGKIYKRSFIEENKIRFLTGAKVLEDSYFALKAYNSTEKIKISSLSGYLALQNPNSLTHSNRSSADILDDILNTLKSVKNDIAFKEKDVLDYYIIKSAIHAVLYYSKTTEKKKFYQKYDILFSWVKANVDKKNKYTSILGNYGEPFSVKMVVSVFWFLQKIKLAKPIVWLISKR